jgi:hypothetical protein
MRNIVGFVLVALFSLHTLANDIPLKIDNICNRHYESPWKNQEEFGYRKWFNPIEIIKDTHFELPLKGKVITILPKSFIRIDLDEPVDIDSIALLCSANFVYGKPFEFNIKVQSADTEEWTTLSAHAHEWFPWHNTKALNSDYVAKIFTIYGDGRITKGLVCYEKVDYTGPILSIRIENHKGTSLQHLMIAAITLIRGKSLPV